MLSPEEQQVIKAALEEADKTLHNRLASGATYEGGVALPQST